MADTAPEKIVVKCACNAKFRVPASVAGKRVKCPKCEQPVRIPTGGVLIQKPSSDGLAKASASNAGGGVKNAAPAKSKSPTTRPPPVPSGGGDLLDMLAVEEQTSVSADPARQNTCTNCASPLSADAVVCVSCGFDTRTGKARKLAMTPEEEAANKISAKDIVKAIPIPEGSMRLMYGLIGSAVGTSLGVGLWYGILVAAQREMAYIAWILGVLAGIGMYVGYRDRTPFAGILAGAMSLVGIFAAKIFYAAHELGSSVFSNLGLVIPEVGKSMANPFDILFALLAIGSAYGIASGLSGED